MYSAGNKLLSFRLGIRTFFMICFNRLAFLLLLKIALLTNYSWALEFSLEARSGSLFYDQLAVQDTLNSFFEPQNQIISSGPLKADDFSNRIQESYDVEIISQGSKETLGITVLARNHLYKNFSSEFGLSYFSGNSKYYFPKGLKPFIEPITLDIEHEEVDIRVAAVFQRRIHSYVIGNIKVGLSRSTGRIRSEVVSNLLDINTSETHLSYNTFLEIGSAIGYKWKVTPSFIISQYANGKFESQLITKLSYEF